MIKYDTFVNNSYFTIDKSDIPTIQKGNKIYYNLPCALDIETTSYIKDREKYAIMYIWQMCIFGTCIYGRTYEQLIYTLQHIKKLFCANGEKMICYVHNLSYDSHFILKWLNVTKIFATDKHEPLYFEHDNFLIFKCSLRLSGKKLSSLSKDNKDIDSKITGFDYSLIRHPQTPLSDDELKYCETDIKIVYQYILSEIAENDNDITEIPYTKTGYARRYCRRLCNQEKYRNWFYTNSIIDEPLYKMFRYAFTGGITHANAIYCNMTLENITNYDLQSDYPAQIVKNKYPSTRYIHDKTITQFPDDIDNISVIGVVNFKNLRAKYNHSILSNSKCRFKCPFCDTFKISCYYMQERKKRKREKHKDLKCECPFDNIDECPCRLELDNGRIIRAGNVTTVLTEIDFYNISLMYDWDSYKILDCYTCKKDYLPRPFVMATLKLYSDKTTLKNVQGYETEYKLAKALLNSLYGMCVTDIVHDEYTYTPDNVEMWECNINDDVQNALEKYRDKHTSFLLYQTGVYITAYARRDLVETIAAICERATDTINGKPFDDIVYYDTDSIKLLNGEKYKDIFDRFNRINKLLMKNAAEYHGFKWNMFEPKDKKGNSHLLGIFDLEKPYRYFKTLGAKRYVYMYNEKSRKERYKELKHKLNVPKYNQISKTYYTKYLFSSRFHITIAGVNKDTGARYMQEKAYYNNCSVFDTFTDGLYFPAGKCGKKVLLYKDNGFSDIVTDYLGNECYVTEKSYIYMSDGDYSMGIGGEFRSLWYKIHDGGI